MIEVTNQTPPATLRQVFDLEVEIDRLRAQLAAITIPTTRFMDQPDGGDVSIAEQVSRMYDALVAAESESDEARQIASDAVWSQNKLQENLDAACASAYRAGVEAAAEAAEEHAKSYAYLLTKARAEEREQDALSYSSSYNAVNSARLRILALPVPEAPAPAAPAVDVTAALAVLEPVVDLVEDYGPFHDSEAIMAGRIRARRGEEGTPPRLTYAHLMAIAALAAKLKETSCG